MSIVELNRVFATTRIVFTLIVITLFIVSCVSDGGYFGIILVPPAQELVYDNVNEPETLDSTRMRVASQVEPVAGLSTHYEANTNNTQFTFYLRGHPHPRGVRLPNTSSLGEAYTAGRLTEDLARGHSAPPDNIPAQWSDGTNITANDFVYSSRRLFDPATASPAANQFYCVKNAEEINSRKLRMLDPMSGHFRVNTVTGAEIIVTENEIRSSPTLLSLAARSQLVRFTREDLGVRAVDDWTLQIDLRSPTAFFLTLLASGRGIGVPVPRQAIESAHQQGRESAWTYPEHIVVSGAFTLQKWQPYDRIVLVKNTNYYEADLVALNQVTILPTGNMTTSMSLYKAGLTDTMYGTNTVPPPMVPLLRNKRDFRSTPAAANVFLRINTARPPFDNVLLRYSLNMAVDKRQIADFVGGGESPAFNFVAPMVGYDPPHSLDIEIDGDVYDILAFNPEAARDLLVRAGYRNGVGVDGQQLSVQILVSSANQTYKQLAEIVQEQWHRNLNIRVTVVSQEFKVMLDSIKNLDYAGVVIAGWNATYLDPNAFLDNFVSGSVQNGTGWADTRYDGILQGANATNSKSQRMVALRACEFYLLRAMPFIPLYFRSRLFLQKPYVRGMCENSLDVRPFKYAWIDTGWKS